MGLQSVTINDNNGNVLQASCFAAVFELRGDGSHVFSPLRCLRHVAAAARRRARLAYSLLLAALPFPSCCLALAQNQAPQAEEEPAQQLGFLPFVAPFAVDLGEIYTLPGPSLTAWPWWCPTCAAGGAPGVLVPRRARGRAGRAGRFPKVHDLLHIVQIGMERYVLDNILLSWSVLMFGSPATTSTASSSSSF